MIEPYCSGSMRSTWFQFRVDIKGDAHAATRPGGAAYGGTR